MRYNKGQQKERTSARRGQRRGAFGVGKQTAKDEKKGIWGQMQEAAIDDCPLEVIQTLQALGISKEDRRRLEIIAKLEVIHGRVQNALAHYGLPTEIHCTASEVQAATNATCRPPGFDTKEQRKRLEKKNTLLAMIWDYVASCEERQRVVLELGDWMQSFVSQDAAPEHQQDEEIEKEAEEVRKSYKEAMDAFINAQKIGEKLQAIGQQIMRAAGYNPDGKGSQRSTPKYVPPPSKKPESQDGALYDDDALLADFDTWRQAAESIQMTMEESIKQLKTNQAKTTMRGSVKQFRFLWKAMERRHEDLLAKDETILMLEMEISRMGKKIDHLQENSSENENVTDKLELELQAAKDMILKLQQESNRLRDEAADEKQTAAQMRAMAAVPRAKSSHQCVTTMQRTESHEAMVADNAALKKDAENYKSLIEELTERIAILEAELKAEREKYAKLEAKLDMSAEMSSQMTSIESRLKEDMKFQVKSLHNENETLERQIARLKTELSCKNELVSFQEKRLQETMTEMGTLLELVGDADAKKSTGNSNKAKKDNKSSRPGSGGNNVVTKLVSRLKKDYEVELDRMKTHLDKEKQRSEAAVRKLEQVQKEQLLNIHKESIRLLRSINRFKESVAQILDRENLPGAAGDVRNMSSLPTEEAPADPRSVLLQMSGNAVELLVALEFKLSQALMNKRLEIKDNTIAKSFATKDLEVQMEAAHKAKQTVDTLQEKMRLMREQLNASEGGLKEARMNTDERYQALTKRYRKLGGQYHQLQKEMRTLQKDYAETIKNKASAMKALETSKDDMARTVEEQNMIIQQIQQDVKQQHLDTERKLFLSMSDQRRNLHLLKKAYTDNQITQDMYQMTVGIMLESMQIPLLRLQQLCNRYIAYRRLKDTRARLTQHMSRLVEDERKEEIQAYLDRMDQKLEQNKAVSQARCCELEEQRRERFHCLNSALSELIEKNGLLFILPTLSYVSQTPQKWPLTRRRGTVLETGPFLPRIQAAPTGLVGTSMSHREQWVPMWRVPETLPAIHTSLDTPKLLELEMTKDIRQAKRALKKRSSLPLPIAEGFDYQSRAVQSICTRSPCRKSSIDSLQLDPLDCNHTDHADYTMTLDLTFSNPNRIMQ